MCIPHTSRHPSHGQRRLRRTVPHRPATGREAALERAGVGAGGGNTSEYVRRAVADYEDEDQLTGTGRELVGLLLRELHTTAEDVHKAVEAAIVQRPYNKAAVRDRVRAELEANPVCLDPAALDFGQQAA